jgi:acyl phosphate:glycerol-3-phosphate acyltransferase
MTDFLMAVGLGYLLGSIPFGYLLVRIFRGEDVRHSGSGNIGATNVSRTSPVLGVLTLILDALKGWLAVWLAQRIVLMQLPRGSETIAIDQLGSAMLSAMQIHERAYMAAGAAALCAVIGHMFPVWLRFSGGKGVATGLGAFVTLAPRTILAMVVVFVLIVLVFRYVSLASITAAALLPVLAAFLDGWRDMPLMLGFMTAASALIIFKHRPNLRRLFAGTENRLHLRHG